LCGKRTKKGTFASFVARQKKGKRFWKRPMPHSRKILANHRTPFQNNPSLNHFTEKPRRFRQAKTPSPDGSEPEAAGRTDEANPFCGGTKQKDCSEQPEPAPKKNFSPCTKKTSSYICTRFYSHCNEHDFIKISSHEQKNVSTIEKEKKEQARFYGENGFCEWS
jgi:hypothetical protein